jgi:uncharacterized protein
MKHRCAGLFLALLLILTAPAAVAEQPVSMWRLDGDNNRVYLLGSIHLLRADDHPLPSVIFEAYEEAEALVMEMDMDDLDPLEAHALLAELGALPNGTGLSDVLGPEAYAEALAYAEKSNVPLSLLEGSEPWLAAITVEQMVLSRIGFDTEYGIETSLARKAVADGKEIAGLETMREQLEFLDNLSLDAQRSLLLQALEESVDIETVMDELIDAWRHGDVESLEEIMLEDVEQYPELYRTIVVQRNRRWLAHIEQLLDGEEDYLVVVGTLHLIGNDSLPTLLEERGHDVAQVREGESLQETGAR